MGRERLGRDIRGREITRAARDGDTDAIALVDELARWVGIGLGSLVNILEPERIAIAGGIVRDWDLFEEVAYAELIAQMEAADQRPQPQVLAARLGQDAGIVGAALLVLNAPN
jgi:glucokinase